MANESLATGRVPWRRVQWVLLPAVVVIVGAFIAGRYVVSPSWRALLDNVHWTTSAVTGAWLAWVGYHSAAPIDRAARRWFAWSLSAYAVGQILFDVQALVAWHPFPGPSDLFYSCFGPGCALGIWSCLRVRVSRSQLQSVALDAGALSIAVLAVTLALYLPKRGEMDVLPLVVLMSYPITLLAALCLGVVSILTLHPKGERSWVVFFSALAADGVLWMQWNSFTLDDKLEDGTWLNFAFSIAALALGVGAMEWRMVDSGSVAWKKWCKRFLHWLPLLLVVVAALSVVLAWTLPGVPSVARYAVGFGVVVVLGIGVFRQSVQLRELDRVLSAERLAKETELRFQTLFETAQDAIFLMTPGEFIECNPSTLRMFGCTRNQIIGHSPVEFSPEIQPDGRRSDFKAPEKIMAAMKGQPQFFEWIHRKIDGTLFDAEVSLNRIELGGRLLLQAIVRDTSKRKQAERELRWRTALFEAQVDSAIDGILVVDAAGKKVIQNKRMGLVWRIPEVIAEDLDDAKQVQFVMDRTKHPAQFAEKVAYLYSHPEAVSRDEIELIDGTVLDRYSAPVRDREGTHYGRIWVFRDITDRKLAESKLRDNQNQLKEALRIARLAYWNYDVLRDEFLFNDEFYAILRTTVEQEGSYQMSSAHYLARFVHPEDRAAVGLEIAKVLTATDSAYCSENEYRIRYADGEVGYVAVQIRIRKNAAGQTVHAFGAMIDHTVSKRAEEALEAERNLLRTLFNALQEYIYVKDTQGRFITCNDRCARVMGAANPQEVIGRMDEDFFSAEIAAKYRADDEAAVRGIATLEKEECLTRPDGSRLYTLTTKLPLRDRRGQIIGMVGSGHDITGHKHLEEQLRQAQKMEAIGQLSGGVAHDFNNLLTVILGNLGLIRSAGHDARETPDLLEQINHAALRAANLTRQLLAFSRQQVMQSQDLDLNGVVGDITGILRRVIGEAVEINVDLAGQALFVHADPSMLEQVLLNLCINARDAMPNGGRLTLATSAVEINAATALREVQSRVGQFAQLRVIDTGIGMSPENLARAFEPFFTTKEVGKGTGLGLASVYGIIQQHNGWVVAESEPGKGTVFTVNLPLLDKARIDSPTSFLAGDVPRGSETILLVEDDFAVRNVAMIALTRLGYRVLLAENGAEAIQVWQRSKKEIQLLITDMVMPGGVTGRDIAERFKMEEPALRVIFMSGYSSDIAGTDFSKAGGDTFLGKPFEIPALGAAVRQCLDQSRAQSD